MLFLMERHHRWIPDVPTLLLRHQVDAEPQVNEQNPYEPPGAVGAVSMSAESPRHADFVVAVFAISRDEHVRAMPRHYKSKLQVKCDVIGGLLAVIAGLFLIRTMEVDVIAWLLIGAGGLLLATVGCSIFLVPHLIYRSQPKLKSEYRLEFDEDGIRFRTDDIDSRLKWSIYTSWLRDEEFYVLYHGARNLSVIPRRSLHGETDEVLARLLRGAVGPSIA